MASINLGELKEMSGFDPSASDLIPEGKYKATAEMFKVGESAKGFPSLGIMYRLENNRTVWDNMYLSENPKAVDIFLQKLAALGVSDFTGNRELEEVGESVIGATVEVTVFHDNYSGTPKEKVKNIRATGTRKSGPSVSKDAFAPSGPSAASGGSNLPSSPF